MYQPYTVLSFIILTSTTFISIQTCPEICKCNGMKLSPSKAHIGHKVICSSLGNLSGLTDQGSQSLPNDTLHLILKENSLTVVPSFSFVKLSRLKKLDLSKNNISEIEEYAFANLTTLEKLDLSHNRITRLLPNVFSPLTSLMRLDISNNPLNCDCHLKWLIEWARVKKVHITPKSSCYVPKILEGVHLLRVPKKEFHCQRPLDLPVFELYPTVNQLIFEGDSFFLHCQVSNEHNIELLWVLNDEMLSVIQDRLEINITASSSSDNNLLYSSLHIDEIKSSHAGFWKCVANSTRGFKSQAVELVVISHNGRFCPHVSSDSGRGRYEWPKSPSGVTVELECTGRRPSSLTYERARAYYTCSKAGIWENLNTSLCPYVSEVTNVLEQFSKSNFSFTHTNVLDSARLLQNYTSDKRMLKDKMDVVFISRTLQKYMPAISHNNEIAEIIVNIINVLMSLKKEILSAAEFEDQACTRILTIIEQLPELLMDAPLNHVTENIAVEDFFVKSETFTGIICSSYLKNNNAFNSMSSLSKGKKDHQEKFLNCNIVSPVHNMAEFSDSIEASLQLPSTIFQQYKYNTISPTHKLQFIIYRNSMLFTRDISEHQMIDVTSLIISGKIAHSNFVNLSEPVIVSLRTAAYTRDVKPVWWDSSAIGGKGGWSGEGCDVIKVHQNVVTFSCNRLASFGLLQDVHALLVQYAFEKAQYHFVHPTIYVGTVLCITPLMATITIYCLAYKNLKMPNKMKHSIINTFLSLVFLCLTFAFGVCQTDIAAICQGVGFFLHYFTLCTLFWMLITASNLYKKCTKSDLPDATSSENIPEQPLPPKPMLRFYLVGWGISSIICGISAAVNIDNYGGIKFCFLSLSPGLGALYGPSLLLLFLLSCLYLLIYCSVRHQNFQGSSEDNLAVHLHDAGVGTSQTVYPDVKSSESEEEDCIQSHELQLQGHATLLLLYILSWMSAYSIIGRPFEKIISYDELLFGLLFCVFGTILGIYSFVFFCYFRADASQHFNILFFKKSDSEINKPIESMPMINNPRSLMQSTIVEDNTESIVLKDVILSRFDSSSLQLSSTQANSSNHSVNNVKIFYDPRQSELARRFFEKNRRQQQVQHIQKNNLEKAANCKSDDSKNLKYLKSSDSSHIVDYKSEPLNEERSSGSQNSILPQNDKYPENMKEVQNNSRFLKCHYLGENMRHAFSSDNNQLPLPKSTICHSCCSDNSSDIPSKSLKHQHWKGHHFKYCENRFQTSKARKCESGTSYSAEDLKWHCRCFCQSYTNCHKSSSNICNHQSNSEISIESCKHFNEN